jgi:hypothetical protein
MIELLKRFHIWVGLFNLTALIVFAATGIAVTLPAAERGAAEVRVVNYQTPGSFSDKEVADDLLAKLNLPLVGPIPEWAVRRNDENVLVLEFHGPNGQHRVTVLEPERRVRVEHARNTIGEFVNIMHATTLYRSPTDLSVRLWALYIDLSIFSLMFMAITGVWLWLASRPTLWWAQTSFAAGVCLFLVLWIATR